LSARTAVGYVRHQPEQTVLYQLIEEHYPAFVSTLETSGGHLPSFVRQEFEDYLKCGLLEHGFLRVKCDGCLPQLRGTADGGVGCASGRSRVSRSTGAAVRTDFSVSSDAKTGAVTLIQRRQWKAGGFPARERSALGMPSRVVRFSPQSQPPFAHAVPRWGLHIQRQQGLFSSRPPTPTR